ncbi:DUF2505 domain-containing protein [Nocardioides litoris]|uniref:DUF2505 domain-containing protein n=1 Tax=Nocardioides litoris TaxID=1926648 RepID=UPI00111E7214|nr:DUF2505 domain-containing protein [Nocardioides litoris]
MAKTIRYEMAYDAPVERVAAMLADPKFREDVCAYQGVTKVEVTIDVDGETKEVTVDQVQPTAGVPSFAKKIVGDETNIVQRESWSSPTHGDVTVTIPGKPGEMTGTAVLTPTDAGTLEVVELTVKVKIPIVSGKLESLIGDLLLKALKAEYKVGRDYLSA